MDSCKWYNAERGYVVIPLETVSDMDVATEPPGMGSRRVSKGITTCRRGPVSTFLIEFPPAQELLSQFHKFINYCLDLFRSVRCTDAAAQETGTAGCCRGQHHVDVYTGFQQSIPL